MSGDGHDGQARRQRFDLRRLVATVLAVAFSAALFGGLLVTWTEQAVFDRGNFADRAVRLLRDDDVRSLLADELTVAVIQNGPSQLAGFRAVIRPVVDELMTTDAFESAFRTAVEEAHRSLFTRGGNDLVVDLSSALGVLASSLQISNPDVAADIPTGLDQLLVEVGNDIQTMQLWQTAEDADQLASGLLIGAVVLGFGAVVLDRSVRRGVFKVGVAAVVAGILLVVVAALTPRLVASSVSDPTVRAAVRSGLTVFLGDLQVLGVWTLAYGVCAAGLATASVPRRQAFDVRVLWAATRDRFHAWRPESTSGRVVRALTIVAAGVAVVVLRDVVLTFAVVLVGAYVAYLGVVELLGVVGRTPADRAAERARSGLLHRGRDRRVLWLAGTAVVLALLVTAGGLLATGLTRSRVAEADERECNGHAELCDRRLDRVAFVGSHNSMSASTEAGWLFAEQTGGIAAQLDYGVRALLVKTHYGIPSGISPFGAPFVVTDRPAELAVRPQAVEGALPAGVGPPPPSDASSSVDPSKRGVYLCHVYCEYGATALRTALDDVKRFLDRNPSEVVILFIGDYVATDDTRAVFQEAGLLDRLHAYDPTAPPPTLGELIDRQQNLVLLSEFSGTPPGWNNPGYGLFQDTPFTFTDLDQLVVAGAESGAVGTVPTGLPVVTDPAETGLVDDTAVEPDPGSSSGTTVAFATGWEGDPSCRPNRGTPESPLFQINHWITPRGEAPTVDQARVVNSYDVLMARVRACTAERGRFPTIVGVNFVTTGDVLEVVDDLNGVG